MNPNMKVSDLQEREFAQRLISFYFLRRKRIRPSSLVGQTTNQLRSLADILTRSYKIRQVVRNAVIKRKKVDCRRELFIYPRRISFSFCLMCFRKMTIEFLFPLSVICQPGPFLTCCFWATESYKTSCQRANWHGTP